MNAKIYPSSIQGEISVPSSKSHTIRALIIATLAGGRSYIRNPLLSDDCKAAMRIAGQFGSTVTAEDGVWIVDGPVDGLKTPDDIVNVDNSGTTLYFMTSLQHCCVITPCSRGISRSASVPCNRSLLP